MNHLLLPLRHAAELLDQHSWAVCNKQHSILCKAIEEMRALRDVRNYPPMTASKVTSHVPMNMHVQCIQRIAECRRTLQQQSLLQPSSTPLPSTSNELLQLHINLADIMKSLYAAVRHLQLSVFQMIRTDSVLRCTCRAALHGELAHVPWRPNTNIQIPTYIVIWDELSGRRLPPMHARWHTPCDCNAVPHIMLQKLIQRHHRVTQASFPNRIITAIMQPVRAEDALVIMEGMALRIDVEHYTGDKQTMLYIS